MPKFDKDIIVKLTDIAIKWN